jgi:hypothetical protein
MRLLALPCVTVYLSVRKQHFEHRLTDSCEIWYWGVSLKFSDIFQFWLKADKKNGLHKDLLMSLNAEVAEWGTPLVTMVTLVSWGNPACEISQPYNHVGGILKNITQADAPPPPMKMSVTPDNSDVTGAIRKGQSLNYSEREIIVNDDWYQTSHRLILIVRDRIF